MSIMATETAINIGLHFGNKVIDLRVPHFVTMEQLNEIVANGLATLAIQLPPKWTLRLVSKNIEIKPDITLNEYPLSNGDQLLLESVD